jgi:hypothetical protein
MSNQIVVIVQTENNSTEEIDTEELREHVEAYFENKKKETRNKEKREHLLDLLKKFGSWFGNWMSDVFLFRLFDCIIVLCLIYMGKKSKILKKLLGWLVTE